MHAHVNLRRSWCLNASQNGAALCAPCIDEKGSVPALGPIAIRFERWNVAGVRCGMLLCDQHLWQKVLGYMPLLCSHNNRSCSA